MEIITKTLSLENFPAITRRVFTEDTLLFDIETTGFSAKKSDVYLIGICYRKDGHAVIEQFLTQSTEEQPELLSQFAKRLTEHRAILTYNGTGFDLPYLREKYGSDPFCSHNILDLYKELSPLKDFLGLSNLKQKTVETFLGLTREDTYSGGDLIPVYRHYTATKDDLPRSLLLLHNYEDVLGMLQLLPVLSYPAFLKGAYQIRRAGVSPSDETLQISLSPQDPFPVRISTGISPFSLMAEGNEAVLEARLFRGELKYFFPDPENYYYLPEEDTAIHRSVGGFVDRAHRVPAKKSNCYTKKSGVFAPQPLPLFTPAFTAGYKDALSYFSLPDCFRPEDETLRRYTDACLGYLTGSKKNSGI